MAFSDPPAPSPSPSSAPDMAASGEAGQRLVALDVVRGIAVLGILVANIFAFGQPMAASVWPGAFLTDPGPQGPLLWGLQLVLVDGKFRGLFALLFGIGLELFHRTASARGHGKGLLARRLFWLALFGFAHWALLWRGDILLLYAVAGFLVMYWVGRGWERQLVLGLILYALGAALSFAASVPVAQTAQATFASGSPMAEVQASLADVQRADLADAAREAAILRAGDYPAMVAHTLSNHLAGLAGELAIATIEVAPLMLVGMGLLGAGLFDGTIARRRRILAGSALWLAGTALSVPIALWAIRGGLTYWDCFAAFNGWLAVPHFLASLGLMALLATWAERAGSLAPRTLASAGRCAFSNYIGTSALALAVFPAWGLDLFGRLDRLELYAVVPLFWALMLAWPTLWLARFRLGPLEWLWRCLTYGRLFPLRR